MALEGSSNPPDNGVANTISDMLTSASHIESKEVKLNTPSASRKTRCWLRAFTTQTIR
jgi:hypothetical protein